MGGWAGHSLAHTGPPSPPSLPHTAAGQLGDVLEESARIALSWVRAHAAALGLPYGFASHFAPALLDEAVATYRRLFRPSAVLDHPHVMVGFNVFAADTVEEARFHATSTQQRFVGLRTGQPDSRFEPPLEGYAENLPAAHRARLNEMLSSSAIGTEEDVAKALTALLARTQADEVIVSGQIFDHAARKHSFALAAQAMRSVALAGA